MYALLVLDPTPEVMVSGQPQYTLSARVIRQGYSDIKVANTMRTEYLKLYPEVNPQNVQIATYVL